MFFEPGKRSWPLTKCENEVILFFIINKLTLKRTHFRRQRCGLDSAAWKLAENHGLEVTYSIVKERRLGSRAGFIIPRRDSRIYRKAGLRCGEHWILVP